MAKNQRSVLSVLNELKPVIVPIDEVPPRGLEQRESRWRNILLSIPDDKAIRLEYENRQRAHQVINSARTSAKHLKIFLSIRLRHGEPAIDGTDKWLVYLWVKKPQNKGEANG